MIHLVIHDTFSDTKYNILAIYDTLVHV